MKSHTSLADRDSAQSSGSQLPHNSPVASPNGRCTYSRPEIEWDDDQS